MDFIFDNISIIGLGIFVFIMVVSNAMTGNADELPEKIEPNKSFPKKRPIQKKRVAQTHPRTVYDNASQRKYDDVWQDLKTTPLPQDGKFIQPTVEEHTATFDSTYIEKIYREAMEDSANSTIARKEKSSVKISKNNSEFSEIFNDKKSLRRAFVASEILGKPKALRRQN